MDRTVFHKWKVKINSPCIHLCIVVRRWKLLLLNNGFQSKVLRASVAELRGVSDTNRNITFYIYRHFIFPFWSLTFLSDEGAYAWNVRSNISNTKKSVSSGYPNPEKRVGKRGRRPSFLTTSRCLDILMKHSSECLI